MQAMVEHRRTGILRHSQWDAILIGLSVLHAALLIAFPSAPLIALGLWWNANTIAHNFIHAPFFRSRRANVVYSAYLSAVLGIPQTLWRNRHLDHHAGIHRRRAASLQLVLEIAIVVLVWSAVALLSPWFFATVYLPGYVAGLGLCFVQGHFEHAGGITSHYGRFYNLCFFNDGYHVEHHARPGEHWTRLPTNPAPSARRSIWPPVLRWLEIINLTALENLVLRSRWLQRFVLAVHERALRSILSTLPGIERVTIVGGGLYPRTAIILTKLLPDAALTIIDRNAEHIESARRFVHGPVTFRHQVYDPHQTEDADLIIIPLAFDGDRRAVYRDTPAHWTLVHDWIWNKHAEGVRVSWFLLKRLNLVTR